MGWNRSYDYLVTSISDTVDTIRALDVKLIGTLVLIILPLTELDPLLKSLITLTRAYPLVGIPLIFIIGGSWTTAFLFSLFGIASLENPSDVVINDGDVEGTYFGTSLFRLRGFHSICPTACQQKPILSEWRDKMNLSKEQVLSELSYEHIKLVFIRNVKMKRQRIAIISTGINILFTATALIVSNCIST